MRDFNAIKIDTDTKNAIIELKKRIQEAFNVDSIILFGSVAREAHDDESDIDILVITKETISNRDQDELSSITFMINLDFGSNISATSVDLKTWESGVYSVLPIHNEIKRDGLVI
jgi:predicted nucleotidyltransferase